MLDHLASDEEARYARTSANLAREKKAFDRMLPDLLLSKPGMFVAMQGGKIIDEDADEFALARRIEAAHPHDDVLIQPVEPPGRDRALIESPEFRELA